MTTAFQQQSERRWTNPVSFIEKTSWIDLCSAFIVAEQVATREELEHAIRMSFAESIDPFAPSASSTVKNNYTLKLKTARSFVASLNISENIPRIAPLVFEGLESAIEEAVAVEVRMFQMIKKKHASSLVNSRQQWIGVGRFPICTLSMMTWMRISKTISISEHEQGEGTGNNNNSFASINNNNNSSSSITNNNTTSWPPTSALAARRFLARMLPLSFIPTFVFQSTCSTIPGLLGTIASLTSEAASGFINSIDPMSRCALICLSASTEGVEAAIVTELLTADVQGEKGFFRTPLSYRCSSDTTSQPSQPNDVFTIAHWFNTSDQVPPFSVAQMHHVYLVHALRRSLCRLEISEPAAVKWMQYCQTVARDVEKFASSILGGGGGRNASSSSSSQYHQQQQTTIHNWMSISNRGVGVRFFDCLLREVALLSEAVSVHMIKPESQLSSTLWILLSHATQGLRSAVSYREYDPLLEIRDPDGSSAANSIILNHTTSSNFSRQQQQYQAPPPLRPFLCTPEQLFALCRSALRCDISMSPSEKRNRTIEFMAENCTEDMLVSLALDPSQISLTLVAMLRFAAEFSVPLEGRHLHLIFSIIVLSPVIGATILNDHMKFLYRSLSAIGRVELLLRILFLPLTAAALEVQMALQEAPQQDDYRDASFCMFHLWRCLAPMNFTSRTQSMPLFTIFKACFSLAFDGNSDFNLMWECCMLDDLCLMGERERAASVCVKDILLDGFFDCFAESKTTNDHQNNNINHGNGKNNNNNNNNHGNNKNFSSSSSLAHQQRQEEEGILFATTFMFRFGVFPRVHCAAILKRLVLHVRVLLGSSSSENNTNNNNNSNTNNNNNKMMNNASTDKNDNKEKGKNSDDENQTDDDEKKDQRKSSNNNSRGNSTTSPNNNNNDENNNNDQLSSTSMASTLLQFLCGFGSGNNNNNNSALDGNNNNNNMASTTANNNAGVLHDDLDRYSDAFFDAVANVLVIAGKFAATQGERAASRVFHSLHDLAWECLTSFKTSQQLAAANQRMMMMMSASSTGAGGGTGGGGENSESILSSRSTVASGGPLNNNNNSSSSLPPHLSITHQQQLQVHNILNELMTLPRRGLPPSSMIATSSPSTTAALILLHSKQQQQNLSSAHGGGGGVNYSSSSVLLNANNNNNKFSQFSTATGATGQSSQSTNTSTTSSSKTPNRSSSASNPTNFTTTSGSNNNNNNNKNTIKNFFFGSNNKSDENSNNNGIFSQQQQQQNRMNEQLTALMSSPLHHSSGTNNTNSNDDEANALMMNYFLYCLEDSSMVLDLQPTINFVGLRIIGLKSLPSVQERMLKRLEAIGVALTHVTAKHVSLRERAVIWLRACWKGAEGWLNSYHQSHQLQSYSGGGGGGNSFGINNSNNPFSSVSSPTTAVGSPTTGLFLSSSSFNNTNNTSNNNNTSIANSNSTIQQLFSQIAINDQQQLLAENDDNGKMKKNKKKLRGVKSNNNTNKKEPSSSRNNNNINDEEDYLRRLTRNASLILSAPEITNSSSISSGNKNGSGNGKKQTSSSSSSSNFLSLQQDELIRERCEQLCITCSSLCNLLLHHNDVLLAAAGGSGGSM